MKSAPARRTHISLPAELVAQIDELVGARGRSAFLVNLASREVRRQRLIAALEDPEPIWKDEDHPDVAELVSAEWVRRMRGHAPSEPPRARIQTRQKLRRK